MSYPLYHTHDTVNGSSLVKLRRRVCLKTFIHPAGTCTYSEAVGLFGLFIFFKKAGLNINISWIIFFQSYRSEWIGAWCPLTSHWQEKAELHINIAANRAIAGLPSLSTWVNRTMVRCQRGTCCSLRWNSMALHSTWLKGWWAGSTSRMAWGPGRHRSRPLESSQETWSWTGARVDQPGVSTTVTCWITWPHRSQEIFSVSGGSRSWRMCYLPVAQRRFQFSWCFESCSLQRPFHPECCFPPSSSRFVSHPVTAESAGSEMVLDLTNNIQTRSVFTPQQLFPVNPTALKNLP